MSGNAIQAVKQFTKTGVASRTSVTKEIAIGLSLGVGAGAIWKVGVLKRPYLLLWFYTMRKPIAAALGYTGPRIPPVRIIAPGCIGAVLDLMTLTLMMASGLQCPC